MLLLAHVSLTPWSSSPRFLERYGDFVALLEDFTDDEARFKRLWQSETTAATGGWKD